MIKTAGRKFTLIEMLVVIAIIGILAAMLMPSLQDAMNSAHSLNCLNNQKLLGYGIGMYSDENNGHMIRSWVPDVGFGTEYWPPFISGKQRTGTSAPGAPANGPAYVEAGPVFLCPVTPRISSYAKQGGGNGYSSEYGGYGMYQPSNEVFTNRPYWTFIKSWRPNGSGTKPVVSTFQMNMVTKPGELILLADTVTAFNAARASAPSTSFVPTYDVAYQPRIHLLHGNNQANALFFDYHASTLDMFDINATKAHPKYFWYKNNSAGFNF